MGVGRSSATTSYCRPRAWASSFHRERVTSTTSLMIVARSTGWNGRARRMRVNSWMRLTVWAASRATLMMTLS